MITAVTSRPSVNPFALIPPEPLFRPIHITAPTAWTLNGISPASTPGNFHLNGLNSPATVAQSIFVLCSTLPEGSTVRYFVDDQLASTERSAPYWMGGESSGKPYGFSLRSVTAGSHVLRAVATLPDGSASSSSPITLNVVPSPNSAFSSSLEPYLNEQSAQTNSLATVLGYVTTRGASLTATEQAVRQQILAMYVNWGIDPSLDYENDRSTVLTGLMPVGWAPPTASKPGTPLSMLFSPDAPYYHPIPAVWPRVQLPSGYINNFQLNTTIDGDGIGFGEVSASSTDPMFQVRSEWYADLSTLKIFQFRMPSNWSASLPWQTAGDRHLIFVDIAANSFFSSYKTTVDSRSGGPDALYASSPTPLGTLGVAGGSNAAGFADLPIMIQPGEATNAIQPIPHAVGGPVARAWAARVFPASARDAGVLTSTNSCTGVGYTNTGLVPYGGVIQLDPSLDLTALKLTLPAFRILQAMQTYGYYVTDFGCSDLDIYTSITEKELDPYGGLWGNENGIGVQNEIQQVLVANKLYVVAPLIKRQ